MFNRKFVYQISLVFSCAALTACFTSSSNTADSSLDMPLKKRVAQDKPASDQGNNSEALLLAHGTVIDWRQFFRELPSERERSILAQKLEEPSKTGSVEDSIEQAHNQLTLGRLRAAETNLLQVLRSNPGRVDVLLDLAQIYLQRRETRQAFEYLSFAKEQMQSSDATESALVFRYRYILAVSHVQRGERTHGHKILSDLIALDKSFAPGYAALGSSYLQIGKDKVAEFIAQRGLDRAGDDPALFNVLGLVEANKGNLSKARQYYAQALAISPTFAPALVNQASTLLKEGDVEAAEASLVKAASYAPADHTVFVALGTCQKEMGRYDAAKQSFEKALAMRPDDADARFQLGKLSMQQLDQIEVALRLFHEVLQVENASAQLKDLARVYIEDLKQNYTAR